MAKNDENEQDIDEQGQDNTKKGKKNKKKDKKKKKKGCLVNLIFFGIIIGLLIWILGFNGLNVRDKYLRPSLEKVPVINKLLPPVSTDDSIKEEIKEEEITKEKQQIDELTKEIDELKKEITRLEVFEKTQVQFREDKKAFDTQIAMGNPKDYSAYYEQIAPENAENLYKQVVGKNVKDKEFKDYINTFESMKKDASAKVLEELLLTDTDIVIDILKNVSSDKRAEILSTMTPENAAICSKLLAPKQ